jgi:hypothetical protein
MNACRRVAALPLGTPPPPTAYRSLNSVYLREILYSSKGGKLITSSRLAQQRQAKLPAQ